MATRKSSKKTGRRSKPIVGKIRVTRNSIGIKLDAASQKKMQECLAKRGKVTFSIKEHSFTRLPAILENGKQID